MTLYTLRKYNLVELDSVYKTCHFFYNIMQLKGMSLTARSSPEQRSLLYFFLLLTELFSSAPLHETLLTSPFFSTPWIFIT